MALTTRDRKGGPSPAKATLAHFLSLLLMLSALVPGASHAAQPTELSLSEAYSMALESNHDIRGAAEGVKQGKLLQKQAVTVLFPKLTANAGYSSLK